MKLCEECGIGKITAWFRKKEVCCDCYMRLKRQENISPRTNLRMDIALTKREG